MLQTHFRERLTEPEESHLLSDFDKSETVTITVQENDNLERNWYSNPTWTIVSQNLANLSFSLLPSFIQPIIRPDKTSRKLHPTAFLDGMRGFASFFVLTYHVAACTYNAKIGYGVGDANRHFMRLPFIRVVYGGAAMVSIFFVVSGFALSYKPVRLMRSKRWDELLHTLASSIFRRGIRLYLPCILSTFLISVLVQMNAYRLGKDTAELNGVYRHKHDPTVEHLDNLPDQVWYWAREMWAFINPWTFKASTTIHTDEHLWTIPVEFRSSLILYLTQAGVARLKPLARMAVLLGLMLWSHFRNRWEMILFFGGFLMAELDVQSSRTASSSLPSTDTLHPTSKIKVYMWRATVWIVFVAGWYLCSIPQDDAGQSIGFMTLDALVPSYTAPRKRFWVGWGALMLVWATANCTKLQRVFTNGVAQYLGKISFALYILHGPVTYTIGNGIMNAIWSKTGSDTAAKEALGWGVGYLATVIVTIYSADLYTTAVDTPTTKLAKWLEDRCSVSLS